jgi:hypothetical protein
MTFQNPTTSNSCVAPVKQVHKTTMLVLLTGAIAFMQSLIETHQLIQNLLEDTKTKNRNVYKATYCHMSRDNIIGKVTGYGLDDRGVRVRVPVGSRIFSSPRHPDRLWGPRRLLSNGYRRLFPQG